MPRVPDIVSTTIGKQMTYRISYDDGLATTPDGGYLEGVTRTEYFRTEPEALKRARELIESGEHQSVSLYDNAGEVLAGIRLQLKLGLCFAD